MVIGNDKGSDGSSSPNGASPDLNDAGKRSSVDVNSGRLLKSASGGGESNGNSGKLPPAIKGGWEASQHPVSSGDYSSPLPGSLNIDDSDIRALSHGIEQLGGRYEIHPPNCSRTPLTAPNHPARATKSHSHEGQDRCVVDGGAQDEGYGEYNASNAAAAALQPANAAASLALGFTAPRMSNAFARRHGLNPRDNAMINLQKLALQQQQQVRERGRMAGSRDTPPSCVMFRPLLSF